MTELPREQHKGQEPGPSAPALSLAPPPGATTRKVGSAQPWGLGEMCLVVLRGRSEGPPQGWVTTAGLHSHWGSSGERAVNEAGVGCPFPSTHQQCPGRQPQARCQEAPWGHSWASSKRLLLLAFIAVAARWPVCLASFAIAGLGIPVPTHLTFQTAEGLCSSHTRETT